MIPSLAVPNGGSGTAPREQSPLLSVLEEDLLCDGMDHPGPIDVEEPLDLQ